MLNFKNIFLTYSVSLPEEFETMKSSDYIKLEKDNSFKGKYLRMTWWWKTPLIIAPILILFTGIIGLIYCLNSNLLLSLYAIPYIIVFLLGTIWFKAVKKHILKSKLNENNAFKVCISKRFATINGYVYLLFTNGQKRHNEYFINNIVDDLSGENIELPQLKSGHSTTIRNIEDSEIMITKISVNKLKKSTIDTNNEDIIPLIYIDNKNTFVILKKDLTI